MENEQLAYVSRHHWVNTLLGIIDSVWHLSPEEFTVASDTLNRLLAQLHVPERGAPTIIPAPLAMEVDGGFYATQLHSPYDSNAPRPVRESGVRDMTLPVDVWVSSLVSLISTAYDIAPLERLYATKTFTDLLSALGADTRVPVYIPDDVARAARDF